MHGNEGIKSIGKLNTGKIGIRWSI